MSLTSICYAVSLWSIRWHWFLIGSYAGMHISSSTTPFKKWREWVLNERGNHHRDQNLCFTPAHKNWLSLACTWVSCYDPWCRWEKSGPHCQPAISVQIQGESAPHTLWHRPAAWTLNAFPNGRRVHRRHGKFDFLSPNLPCKALHRWWLGQIAILPPPRLLLLLSFLTADALRQEQGKSKKWMISDAAKLEELERIQK